MVYQNVFTFQLVQLFFLVLLCSGITQATFYLWMSLKMSDYWNGRDSDELNR